MLYQSKEARLKSGLTATEAARKLGVTQPTVSNWDAERKIPSVEMLCKIADLYGVSTDYLLNRSGAVEQITSQTHILHPGSLPAFHGGPVWSVAHGWGIVDAIKRQVLFLDAVSIPFSEVGELTTFPPRFSQTFSPTGKPLSRSSLSNYPRLWSEPISPDSDLRMQLRGWYAFKGNRMENDLGQSFYLDTYVAKWLASPENP